MSEKENKKAHKSTVTETASQFVCPIDGQEFDTFAALKAHFEAVRPEALVPKELIKFTVNGEGHALKVEPNWTLAYTLREMLGLIGTKVGCDEGACGACAVIMDGRPILSCTTLAVECDGKNITTIEGLAGPGGKLHPIQQAFVEKHGMQCGFCTPGMIMPIKVLLDENPAPTVREIVEAISGNLCRCGNYDNVVSSVQRAVEIMKEGGTND